jgi:hypothetical protein
MTFAAYKKENNLSLSAITSCDFNCFPSCRSFTTPASSKKKKEESISAA